MHWLRSSLMPAHLHSLQILQNQFLLVHIARFDRHHRVQGSIARDCNRDSAVSVMMSLISVMMLSHSLAQNMADVNVPRPCNERVGSRERSKLLACLQFHLKDMVEDSICLLAMILECTNGNITRTVTHACSWTAR